MSGQGELFPVVEVQPCNGWRSGWNGPRGCKLGRWFELVEDGEVLATVQHCGHPTALRPWHVLIECEDGSVLSLPRKWSHVGDARAYAVAAVDWLRAEGRDDDR